MRASAAAQTFILLLAASVAGCSDSRPRAGDGAVPNDGGSEIDAEATADARDGGAEPTPGVGDSCLPVQVPEGGFLAIESYVETHSDQCATRTCMVYQLTGNPLPSCDPSSEICTPPEEVADQVYCTCRCSAPPEIAGELCTCTDGFACEPLIGLGPAVGGYCVRQ